MPNARPILALVALLALTAACGDEPAPRQNTAAGAPASTVSGAPTTAAASATTAPPGPAASATAQAVTRDLTYTITRRKASPPTGRVEVARNAVVRITVTSDEADELHLHGYDLELPLAAGTPGSLTVQATKTGLFEVETHTSHLVLFQLVVR